MTDPPRDPPPSLRASLRYLGPGIILASALVGSGELIATTTVGAEAGFSLLWLIVIGCGIKVAAQLEIGRHTLAWGRTPLVAFDAVPGPRLGGRNWIFWGWAAMTALVLVQQGGILMGVAQTLAAGVPLSTAGREWNRVHDAAAAERIAAAAARRAGRGTEADSRQARVVALETEGRSLTRPTDATVWAVVTALATSALLAVGRYRLLERLSAMLVFTFVVVTMAAVLLLQCDPAWAIDGRELAAGLVPTLPPAVDGRAPLRTALATFGIIGVAAGELVMYPYWCLEKGYGRAVGPREDSDRWAARVRGWSRVLALDAWSSMIVYTSVTVAFYFLGAATLGRLGLRPAGGEMVRTLGATFGPAFGSWSNALFLTGAFAVLYSTLLAVADGNARIIGDACVLAGLVPDDASARRACTRRIACTWPLLALVLAIVIREPVGMVLASGAAQSVMLAALGGAVLWFRYGCTDARLVPSRAWDLLLWASSAGLVTVGLWTVWQKAGELLATRP